METKRNILHFELHSLTTAHASTQGVQVSKEIEGGSLPSVLISGAELHKLNVWKKVIEQSKIYNEHNYDAELVAFLEPKVTFLGRAA